MYQKQQFSRTMFSGTVSSLVADASRLENQCQEPQHILSTKEYTTTFGLSTTEKNRIRMRPKTPPPLLSSIRLENKLER